MTPMQRLDLLKAACCVSGVDSTDPAEEEIVRKLAKEIGVGDASLQAMMARAKRDDEFCREQFRLLNEEPSDCMSVLLQVALADGKLTEPEVGVLSKLSAQLGIAPAVFDQLMVEARKIIEK